MATELDVARRVAPVVIDAIQTHRRSVQSTAIIEGHLLAGIPILACLLLIKSLEFVKGQGERDAPSSGERLLQAVSKAQGSLSGAYPPSVTTMLADRAMTLPQGLDPSAGRAAEILRPRFLYRGTPPDFPLAFRPSFFIRRHTGPCDTPNRLASLRMLRPWEMKVHELLV